MITSRIRLFSVIFILLISTLLMPSNQAESACVVGNGNIINNVGWFSINACEAGGGIASGTIIFDGNVVHSGNQNSLVGAKFKFDGTVNKLTFNGPYVGYAGIGTLTLCDQNSVCSEYPGSTLFPPGSNVKDTARQVGGYTRGFDDFNISVIYGTNQFITANGFVESCGSNNEMKDCIMITP